MLPEWRIDPKTKRALISTAIQCRGLLIIAGEDGAVRTWNARFRLFKKELKNQKGGITSLAANSRHLFSGSRDGTIIAWALEDWLPDYRLAGFSCGIQRMACNEDTLLYKTLVFGTTGMVDTRTMQRSSSIWNPNGFHGNTIDFSITATRMATTTDESDILNSCHWRLAGKLENKTPTIDEQIQSRDKVIAKLSRESAALENRLGTR